MKRILYIEPFSGISGDMFVGALLDLMPNRDELFEKIMLLRTHPGFHLSANKVSKNAITALKFDVNLNEEHHHSDHYHGCSLQEIYAIIDSAQRLDYEIKELAKKIFFRLAQAESKIHGMETDHVHFHEVGAVDSIVDIVFSALLIKELKIDEVISSPPVLGSGTINTMHGILPVPAPATAEILKGSPITHTDIKGELTTPTGAAILTEIVTKWGVPSSGKISAIGYGAGSRNYPNQANVLRVSIIEEDSKKYDDDRVVIIETNIDDMPGEFLGHISNGLFKLGVLDYAVIPATMKKGRQGFIIQVICPVNLTDMVSDYILKNTTTLGVRYRTENRKVLERKSLVVSTSYGDVRVKISGNKEDGTFKVKPEMDDVSRIIEERELVFSKTYSEICKEISSKI